jgi:hypothetical protein
MKALLINFPQNDFCSFGAVEISNSEKIIFGINNILQQFDFIILNQLWLEADDIHFAANYPFYKPGMTKKIEGREIILTPIFCVKNSFGAEISSKLRIENNIHLEKSCFVELNEAFAGQSLACLKLWPELDPAKVNINGGAIAIGHPLGASGVRIIGSLAHTISAEAKRSGRRIYGLAAICIGVGQGLAMVIEA